MKSHTDYSPAQAVSVLCVGEPGTGKTRLGFAFPVPGIVDWDMNLNSGFRVNSGKPFFYDQPAVADDGSEVPFELRWERAVKMTKDMLLNPEIKTIWVDGLGLMCECLLAHVTKENKKAGVNKTGRTELGDYREFGRLLRQYVTMLRVGGKYVYVTSHQTGDRDELTGAMRYALAIPGQSKDTLGGLFTDVWATSAKPQGLNSVKYEIRTRPTGLHVALKTSFDMASAIDVTDKTPEQIWAMLSPKLNIQTK